MSQECPRSSAMLSRDFGIAGVKQVISVFSANRGIQERMKICSILGVKKVGDRSMYLDLLNILGRNNSLILDFFLKKKGIRKNIQSREGQWLSRAGKELLLKTVA